ncbi:hypothetical protein CY34DRAFT_802091 [Suillus luteus UH-Slu-Lm8-n1]|uniref:Uncharacterized protein n=1 Tax=Suillus luteus UH-Slu-Lm8-n1 TaxID=930992 RepID=A0A0D0BPF9_9AGAM|nr:hypothetical protein CY34DRAFT_802091 [Suillus luteus UH-Slu-Lm8-n1]
MYRYVQLSLSQLDRPISYFNAVTLDIDSCQAQAFTQSPGLQFNRESEVLNSGNSRLHPGFTGGCGIFTQ